MSAHNEDPIKPQPTTAQLRELLAAALANSHACQNWLSTPSPNLDRARESIAHVVRDLALVAALV